MKFFNSALVLTLFAGLLSCNQVDKELVGTIQNDIREMEGMSGVLTTLGTNITNFAQQVNAAPEGLKAENNPDFNDLVALSNGLVQKQETTFTEYKDLMVKMKTLVSDYSSGKLDTEQTQKEYDNLKTGMKGISDLISIMTTTTDQLQTQYAKMSASWNAKAENGG